MNKISKNSQIKSIKARKILDSRKNPTVEVVLKTASFLVKSSVPSGASTGKNEAIALPAKAAVKNVNEIIAPKLIGKDCRRQKAIDDFLVKLDGTKNKSRLGANAILGVSLAVCRAGAKAKKIPLYHHIYQFAEVGSPRNWRMPFPCFNLINGGKHARKGLDIQEFMVVGQEKSFANNLKIGKEIFVALRKILEKKFGKKNIKIGDEGGFVPPLAKTKEALDLLIAAAKTTSYFKKMKIGLDCAATNFLKGKKYQIDSQIFSQKELLNFYQKLVQNYPILFLEDPFAENDWSGWQQMSFKLQASRSKLLIVGDDLVTTNLERIKEAKKKKVCNAMILKPNQIGTVSEAIAAANLAKKFHWKTIVSHRSGETLDDFIADFSVGIGADFIKSGAPGSKERMTKYQRLVKIEKELCSEKLSFLASR